MRDVPALNSLVSHMARQVRQTADKLSLFQDNSDDLLILVTDQVNITALTGVFPQSGELVVAERTPAGLTVTALSLIGP